jgi:hypothetical protein
MARPLTVLPTRARDCCMALRRTVVTQRALTAFGGSGTLYGTTAVGGEGLNGGIVFQSATVRS